MHEFAYQHKHLLGSVVPSVLWVAVMGFIWHDGEGFGLDWTAVAIALSFALLMYVIQFSYVFNDTLELGGGKLTLHRRIGKTVRVPLHRIGKFRIEEHRYTVWHRARVMTVRYDDRKLKINVSDLAEEEAFIRALESRLEGRATVLNPPDDLSPLELLQRRLEQLRP